MPLIAVVRFTIPKEGIDEFVKRYHEVVPPAFTKYAEDYLGSDLGINPDTGAAIHRSGWTSCPRMPIARDVVGKLAGDLGIGDYDYEWYEEM